MPFAALQPLAAVLQSRHSELQAEFAQLEAAKALKREQECIHATGKGLGHWTRFEITWTWLDLDADGCAARLSCHFYL